MYRRHEPTVLAYALRRAPAELAKDAVAETFLAAWRRFDELGADPLPWLIASTRRTLANQRRSSARQARLAERLAAQPPERLSPADPSGDAAAVRAALQRLPADDREALALVGWDGLTPLPGRPLARPLGGCLSRAAAPGAPPLPPGARRRAGARGSSPEGPPVRRRGGRDLVAVIELALTRANPVPEEELRLRVPQDWSDELLAMILSDTAPAAPLPGRAARRRLLLVAALVITLLAVPTYAVGRAVIDGWLTGEPAPQSAVDNFGSYTPQLGFHPEAGNAVVVARDGAFSLYATPNDRGSYCVATSTPDGGICIHPDVAAAALIAGIMPGDPTRPDARGTVLVAGRVADPRAATIAFADPDGATVTRPIGSSGFFLAALSAEQPTTDAPPYPCKNGDWRTTFRALGASGDEVAAARITLARTAPVAGGGCGWANGPHR